MIARQLLHPWIGVYRERLPLKRIDRAEMLVLIVSVCALLLVCGLTMAVDRPSPTMTAISVRSGDTLWSLAAQYGDPNTYILQRVDDLRQANGLKAGQPLHEGQVLRVPNVQRSTSNFQRSTAGG
jgi:nucleoid-associated protein YgaU